MNSVVVRHGVPVRSIDESLSRCACSMLRQFTCISWRATPWWPGRAYGCQVGLLPAACEPPTQPSTVSSASQYTVSSRDCFCEALRRAKALMSSSNSTAVLCTYL